MIYHEIITYTQHRLIGFDLRGLPIYILTPRQHTVYACSRDELKKRIREWRSYLENDLYVCHRHPRTSVQVLP